MFPWYIKYPNQNDEILNLDWILSTIENLVKETDNFINLNTIKYAEPILWDITSQYEANTITVDPQTGDGYISTKAVPYGVILSNTNYWTKIYNYADAINTLEEQIANANEKLSTTASAPRNVGDLVWLNGLLYRVTAPMITGDSYVVNSNCVKTTIEAELNTEIQNRSNADTQLQNSIDAESLARSNADNTLQGNIDAEALARSNADITLQNNINNLNFNKKNIIVIGDSYAEGYSPDGNTTPFIDYLSSELGAVLGEFYHAEQGGAGLLGDQYSRATFLQLLQSLENTITNKGIITDIVFEGFINDLNGDSSTIITYVTNLRNYIRSTYPKANIIFYNVGRENSSATVLQLVSFNNVLISACNVRGIAYVDNAQMIMHVSSFFSSDNLHPNQNGQMVIGSVLAGYLMGKNVCIDNNETAATITSDTNTFNTNGIEVYHQNDKVIVIRGTPLEVTIPAQMLNANSSFTFTIGTINSTLINNLNAQWKLVHAIFFSSIDNSMVEGTVNVGISGKDLVISGSVFAGSNFMNASVNKIILEKFSLELNGNFC